MRKRTAQFIEEQKAALPAEGKGKRRSRATGVGRGNNPNSRKGVSNLKPFPPGVSGNPGGLPGYNVAEVIARRALEQYEREDSSGLLDQLRKGNAYAFSVLADRGFGKVKEKHEITGADNGPLDIKITIVKARDGGN